MLDFSDLPYHWFGPKRNQLIALVVRHFNRTWYLRRKKQISEVVVTGSENVAGLAYQQRVMLVVNHPTHADAAIILEACRHARIWPTFMAAYDVFLRSRFDAFVMQRLGAFSVDREGSDSRAMKHATEVLMRKSHPLTIFPEGNVYLEIDRVSPFHDGAAFMALRAQKDLPFEDETIYALPVSIKATYIDDIRAPLKAQIELLAQRVDVDISHAASPAAALRIIGTAALHRNLKTRGLDTPESDVPRELIEHAAGIILSKLEAKLDLQPRPTDSYVDRVRKARRIIHEVRTDSARVADHAAAGTWADEAMLAYRLLSYSGQYAAEKPTLDRLAETTEKMTEDIHRAMPQPFGRRRAIVHFGAPMAVSEYLADGAKLRQAVGALTADLESSVQAGVDDMNQANTARGAELWPAW